ncbi:MAG: nucleotidyl transferase AbiEii/AbiGii toxin family protein [Pyrinomonadaceae bacterium]
MKNEIDVIRDLAGKFAQGGIEYMLTGSLAMNYYAQPRMTRDIDVVVALEPQDADPLTDLFAPDYYVVRDAVASAIARESVFNLIHQEAVIKVDCIVRKSGEYRQLEFVRRRAIKLRDFTIWIVSKEDLIISKLDWARDSRSELQLRDVRNLLATGYDARYVEEWTQKSGLADLWQECLHE